MTTTTNRIARTSAALAMALALLVAAGACSPKYSSERDGKALGTALCDLREANDIDERADAIEEIDEEIENLQKEYAIYTADDREAFRGAIDAFKENAQAGDGQAMQQDLASMDIGARNVASSAGEVTRAAWDGFRQGLSNCIG